MSNRNYESQILDAIQILVDDAVSKAEYDRTIKATISRCVDPTIGKYIIKYQDSSFYAYSYNTENTYSAGTSVYVLIPGNDMSQEKSIIGTVDKLGIDYVSIIEGENGYEVTGLNVITSHSEYGLCSYNQSDVKILYHRDENINLIELDTFGFKKYIEQSEAIICGATFKTSLSSQQKTRGDYGIVFDLDFIDNSTGEEVTRSYMLNIDQMTGQPYNFTFPSRQYDIFDVDGANFISVKQIYIFAYDFPYTEENKADDIFVSKIELSAANALDRETVSTAALSFITPQGIYFDENDLDSDIKTIEAQIKIKGQNIDNDSQKDNIDYYWFKENGNITTKSQQYNQIGGAGWECLNSYNVIEEATESQDAIVTWVPGDYKIYVSKENHIARETKYKCVAVYKKETTLSKTISIFNYDSNYDITITSDEGTAFYYDSGTPTLTCYVNGQEQLGNDYVYAWTSMDSGNRFSNIQETQELNIEYNDALSRYNELQEGINNHTLLLSEVEEELSLYKKILNQYEYIMRVEKNKIHQLKISEITKFTTYKCSVFKTGVLLGTASITISNSLENNIGYSVVINNGNQVFKYNEQGIAPNCPALENPITVLPLSFTIYDNQGREVSNKTLKQHEIKWYIPIDKTLIDVEGIYPNPDEIHGSMGLYYDLRELSFSLANRFNATNDNNIIKLEIEYQGNKLSTQTSFVFTKTGEVGTNGTDFICKIIPNTNDIAPMNPMVTYNEYSKTYKINYNCLNNQWFKVQLWNDGENIFEGTQNGVSSEGKEVKVTWSILKNDYGKDIQDFSNLTIDKNTGVITFVENEYEHPANIVKCSIKYNNAEYYAVMPVITSRVKNEDYEILLTDGYGYKSVMYTTDGVSPSYDTTSPHDITVNQVINGVKSNISLYESENYKVDYEWLIKGNAYYLEWQLSQNLLKNTRYKTKEDRNRKFFKPSDTYNGLCVNNAIECIITQKGERIGSIHMPIHLYLNRYGNSAMNSWDGNSISVGDNDGKQLILAPQVGAGTKDDATNQFTGVFMGSIKEAGKDKEEHGLFGYSGGERTIALSSTDGSARFGRAGLGQIVIDPSTNQALITSGNYNEDEGKGMAINLSEPSIKFANGNFEVDKDGQIWATQYATKNMKFDSSSVNGLDDRLDNLDTTVEDLNATINYLDVVLPTNNVTVETDTLRMPTHTDTKTIECLTTYKGTIIKPTVKIEGSHPGITNVSSSYDTERGLTILSFHVDSTQAISDATNNYNVTFSYNKENCSPVTKIVSILVIEKGKDGTSVNIKGTEKNIADLCKNHPSGNILGDGYVLEDDGNGETGHLFIFTNEGGGNGGLAADWKDVGRIQGTDGVNGRGVQSITYQYLTNNSSIKPSATDTQWKDIMSVPTEDKRFLWQKEIITFVEVDGQLTEQDTVLLLAVYGESGNGITKTEVGYQIWTDGTTIPTGTWLPNPPETQAGDYL